MKTFTTVLRKTEMKYGPVMFLYILATTVTAAGLVLINRISGEMTEAALLGDVDVLTGLLLMTAGVMAVRAAATAVSTIVLARFSAKAGYALRGHFVRHFLRVPFKRVERDNAGENLSIYSNDIPNAVRLVADGIFELVADFISFVSAFIFLLIISPRFTGIAFIAAIAMLVVQIILSLPLARWGKVMSEKAAGYNAVVNDSLQNLSTIASYNLEEQMEENYMVKYADFFKTLKRFTVSLSVLLGSMMTLFMSPLIVIFTVLAFAVIGGELSLAEFVAFSTTILVAAGAVMQLAQNVGRLATASAGAKRLNENTDDAHETVDTATAQAAFADTTIVFYNVTFSYGTDVVEEPPAPPPKKKGFSISFGPAPTEEEKPAVEEKPDEPPAEKKPALANASFTIPHNNRVAIVGGSGSGKSTLLKLLLGLYEPTEGTVTLGGKDINTMQKSHLRDAYAYVPQDSFLFPESIGKNISLAFNGTAPGPVKLEKAAAEAGILDFIQSLPEGFDAVLTEAADNVSGGQRQRIAMARAFYKDAPVILFDEATASLDPATEAAVLDSFAKTAREKTVIMVAHRPQAIAACDTIIVMYGGKVAGIGSHDDLLVSNEVYKQLASREVL